MRQNIIGKTLKLYFGGTVVSTLTTTDSDRHVYIHSRVQRTASGTVRVASTMHYSAAAGATGALNGATSVSFVTGLTLTNTQVFKITGQGSSTDDMTINTADLKFFPGRP